MIDVIEYTKLYGDTVAVQSLSFRVAPGDVLGLVGPNGAGKTTTLRALAGILQPTSGSIRIADIDLQTDPVAAKARLANFLAQFGLPLEKLQTYAADIAAVTAEQAGQAARTYFDPAKATLVVVGDAAQPRAGGALGVAGLVGSVRHARTVARSRAVRGP